MMALRIGSLSVLAASMAVALPSPRAAASGAAGRMCSLVPGRTLALVKVEKDTTLPLAPSGAQAMSMSGVRPGGYDSLLATASTLMPAARVRLLQVDAGTRAMLASAGITDRQPSVLLRAAPYRADCRTIRWTDAVPFVVRGETGFVRATLAPREQWVGGTPVLVIPDAWYYPYPHRRGLAYGAAPGAPMTPAAAMFTLSTVLESPPQLDQAARAGSDSARAMRAIDWARANPTEAELEPARSLVRSAILDPDMTAAQRLPSRLRGSYRVDMDAEGQHSTWYFRTTDRPAYGWRGHDTLQTTAALVAAPYIPGYQLLGYASASRDSLRTAAPRGSRPGPLVWLATNDQPTSPANDARRTLSTILEFKLSSAPEQSWDALEPLIPPTSARDSAALARMRSMFSRADRQPRVPLTLHLDAHGPVQGDTTLNLGTHSLRVKLERMDTLSVTRPF